MNKKLEKIFISLLTVFSLCLLGSLLFLRIYYLNLIYPQVTISGVPVGGLSQKAARSLLNSKADAWKNTPITFTYKNHVWGVTPENLGISINTDEMARAAFAFGHDQNIGVDLLVFARTLNFLKPHNVETIAEVNMEKFLKSTKQHFSSVEIKKIDSTVIYENNKFAIKPSKSGVEVDKDDLLNQLKNDIYAFSAAPIEIKLAKTWPEIDPPKALAARERAEKITAAPLVVSYNDKTWTVPVEIYARWIKFKAATDPKNPAGKILALDADQTAIGDYLEGLAPEINQEPVNAELTVKDGKVVVFALSQDGFKLKTEDSAGNISQAILNEAWTNAAPLPLVVERETPEVTTDNINNLGITSRIGVGTSNFAGSPKNRRYNISVGAAKFHGVLIKPGEEFSFVQTLGPITTQEGYRAELVIKKGETVPELGGGLCQVSTTAFRAAISAGLPITERRPHAYPVIYYNPQGMDSTIYPPHPDLRFINDTPGHILIQTQVVGNTLTFEFYGTDDGRKVEIRGPEVYDKKSDGSMKAVFYRDIYHDGQITRTDTFNSVYKSPALYPHKNPLE